MKYVVTQNSGDKRDARCSDDEEQKTQQYTHHDFNESEDTLLRCCIANNSRISFSCHNIRSGNPYHYIFTFDILHMLKILTKQL